MNDYRNLCRGCGGFGDGTAKCTCGHGNAAGRLEDIATMSACAEATGLECLAAGTLDKEVIVAMDEEGSFVVLDAGGRRSRRDPGELLPPDLEVEVSERFTLELSRDDAAIFRNALEKAGWRVGESRERRRNDVLVEMARLDAAAAATGVECVSAATVTDEAGEPYAEVIVARDANGSFWLLDEAAGHGTLPPGSGLVVLLPKGADERVAVGLTKAGYALHQPRMTLRLASGAEFVCKLPHMRDNTGTGKYAGMKAASSMLSALEEFGSLACFEMSAITGKRHRTLSGRLADLQTEGLIRATGEMRDCDITGTGQHVYGLGCDPDRVGVRRTGRRASEPSPWNGGGRMGDIVDYLLSKGDEGATTSEITRALGGEKNGVVEHAVSASTSNLRKLGVLRETGKKPSDITGRQQTVFVACPAQAASRGHAVAGRCR